MAEFETVVVETDLLILGGGMAACGSSAAAGDTRDRVSSQRNGLGGA